MDEILVEAPSEPLRSDYRDRRTGLSCFGALLIVLGCLCALVVPLILLSAVAAARTPGHSMTIRPMVPSALLYGIMAVTLVWLGIGSIMARRWARALLLILSWGWLTSGVLATAMMAILFPSILADTATGDKPASSAQWILGVFLFGFLGAFFILLPGLLVLFYGKRDVKKTCEARDPAVRWTDACPLPLLALSLLVGLGAATMPLTLLAYNGVAPCFGILVTGAGGVFVFLVASGVLGYCAWALYHRSLAGWWLTLTAYGLIMISTVVTFARVDLIEMYRLMGFSEAQLDQVRRMNFLNSGAFVGIGLASAVLFFGYMAYVKRFIHPAR